MHKSPKKKGSRSRSLAARSKSPKAFSIIVSPSSVSDVRSGGETEENQPNAENPTESDQPGTSEVKVDPPRPKVKTYCPSCDQYGHDQKGCSDYRKRMKKYRCLQCQNYGHEALWCPYRPCVRCKQTSHREKDCTEPETYPCDCSGNEGHLPIDCPYPPNCQCTPGQPPTHMTYVCRWKVNTNRRCRDCKSANHLAENPITGESTCPFMKEENRLKTLQLLEAQRAQQLEKRRIRHERRILKKQSRDIPTNFHSPSNFQQGRTLTDFQSPLMIDRCPKCKGTKCPGRYKTIDCQTERCASCGVFHWYVADCMMCWRCEASHPPDQCPGTLSPLPRCDRCHEFVMDGSILTPKHMRCQCNALPRIPDDPTPSPTLAQLRESRPEGFRPMTRHRQRKPTQNDQRQAVSATNVGRIDPDWKTYTPPGLSRIGEASSEGNAR